MASGHGSRVTYKRWKSLCADTGCTPQAAAYNVVVRNWKSWGRRYHTLDHLDACLRELDGVRDLAVHPSEVEFALWFHDAAYSTFRTDNELRSAELAARTLSDCELNPAAIGRVCAGVRATEHAAAPLQGDAALVVDIDLAILGAPSDVYGEFERGVRREYWWVPRRRYAAARTAVLQAFLDRPSIYHFDRFRERLEATARVNLRDAIDALKS